VLARHPDGVVETPRTRAPAPLHRSIRRTALPQDNAYVSIHQGSGVAFAAHPMFTKRTKVLGVRFLHDYAEARHRQGYANNEATGLQAHFHLGPGSPPASVSQGRSKQRKPATNG